MKQNPSKLNSPIDKSMLFHISALDEITMGEVLRVPMRALRLASLRKAYHQHRRVRSSPISHTSCPKDPRRKAQQRFDKGHCPVGEEGKKLEEMEVFVVTERQEA
eukprot:c2814_g1_i1.p2 GENE.c2814_g1_i1~~c2814_g1_i1.p2  ORF type:complete len:105 (-),score=16.26 c2814_g1_i1:234-548(-)